MGGSNNLFTVIVAVKEIDRPATEVRYVAQIFTPVIPEEEYGVPNVGGMRHSAAPRHRTILKPRYYFHNLPK